MKKLNKKVILIALLILLVILAIVIGTYKTLNDENKFTVEEKEWITENLNVLQNVHILNNIDVFGKNGSGVLYDFVNDIEKEFKLDVNLITYNYGETITDRAFKILYEPEEKDMVIHT